MSLTRAFLTPTLQPNIFSSPHSLHIFPLSHHPRFLLLKALEAADQFSLRDSCEALWCLAVLGEPRDHFWITLGAKARQADSTEFNLFDSRQLLQAQSTLIHILHVTHFALFLTHY